MPSKVLLMNYHTFFTVIFLSLLTSCANEESLQRYYVDNQENKDFFKMDIPASLFANTGTFEPEQQKILKTIRKVNLLAIPKKADNAKTIEEEKQKISEILNHNKYQLLVKYGGGNKDIQIYYSGEEEAVDEIILFGFDPDKGVGIARLLGKNMNPTDIVNLFKSIEAGEVNIDTLDEMMTMFQK